MHEVSGSRTHRESATPPPADDKQAASQPTDSAGRKAAPPDTQTQANRHRPDVVVHSGLGEVARGSSGSSNIALTFDAGADSRPAGKILDVLAKHSVHATFFLTGKWIEKNGDLARRIVTEGHEIGNHTYSHTRLTELTSDEITDEMDRTERLALEVTGQSTKPYMRVPYGSRDKRVLGVLGSLGYRSVYWDVDCWDSVKKGITSKQIEDRVLSKVRNGSVVLMHCGSQATADALDSLLTSLESAGYKTMKVSSLLGG